MEMSNKEIQRFTNLVLVGVFQMPLNSVQAGDSKKHDIRFRGLVSGLPVRSGW